MELRAGQSSLGSPWPPLEYRGQGLLDQDPQGWVEVGQASMIRTHSCCPGYHMPSESIEAAGTAPLLLGHQLCRYP